MKEIRVNFSPLVKQLELSTKKQAFGLLMGDYSSQFKSKGLEFDGYRIFSKNDDASLIDWKASLRVRDLLVRNLQEERNLEITFMVDVSSSMSYASVDKLKNEYTAELVAALSASFLRGGDAVGLVMFSDKVVARMMPQTGTKQFYGITKLLANPKLYDGKFDFQKSLRQTVAFLRRNSILIIVSDFLGLKGDWKSTIKYLGAKYELIGIMIRDPQDNKLQDVGQVTISDPYSEKELILDTTAIGPSYEQAAKQQINETRKVFTSALSDLLVITTDKPFFKPLYEFFLARKERWH